MSCLPLSTHPHSKAWAKGEVGGEAAHRCQAERMLLPRPGHAWESAPAPVMLESQMPWAWMAAGPVQCVCALSAHPFLLCTTRLAAGCPGLHASLFAPGKVSIPQSACHVLSQAPASRPCPCLSMSASRFDNSSFLHGTVPPLLEKVNKTETERCHHAFCYERRESLPASSCLNRSQESLPPSCAQPPHTCHACFLCRKASGRGQQAAAGMGPVQVPACPFLPLPSSLCS